MPLSFIVLNTYIIKSSIMGLVSFTRVHNKFLRKVVSRHFWHLHPPPFCSRGQIP